MTKFCKLGFRGDEAKKYKQEVASEDGDHTEDESTLDFRKKFADVHPSNEEAPDQHNMPLPVLFLSLVFATLVCGAWVGVLRSRRMRSAARHMDMYGRLSPETGDVRIVSVGVFD